jgi:hypothetical protein
VIAQIASKHAMSAESRAVITYGLGLLGGTVLFFLSFAAIFVGSWVLLLCVLLCYAAAGALGVRVGRVAPSAAALILAAPAVPWLLWLFPASLAEAGLLRALLWPGIAGIAGGLGWLGGRVAAARGARKPPERRAA